MHRDTNNDAKQHQRSNVYQDDIDVHALKKTSKY